MEDPYFRKIRINWASIQISSVLFDTENPSNTEVPCLWTFIGHKYCVLLIFSEFSELNT
jgi:hypothetical protein